MASVLRIIILIIFAGFSLSLSGQAQQPTLPYYDWNACPGEGCTYGKWCTRRVLPVFDNYKNGRRQIAQLKPGDQVTAVTGVVITFRPGVIRFDRDYPEQGFKRGDTILTYAYRGEGTSAVWFKNKYLPDFDIAFTKWPDGSGCGGNSCPANYLDLGQKAWWAKVRLASGLLGWIDMDHAQLDGTCAFAGRQTK